MGETVVSIISVIVLCLFNRLNGLAQSQRI